MNATDEYTLLDARQHPQQYKELFAQYCAELMKSDPTIAQYAPDALAEENLQSSLDHPYLIAADDKIAGLVVFMDEEAPGDENSCHAYLGEMFVQKPYRRRGIASRLAGGFLAAQEHDAGLCYIRGSAAEGFWQRTVAKLGYSYEIFPEDEIRDFMHIHLPHRREA